MKDPKFITVQSKITEDLWTWLEAHRLPDGRSMSSVIRLALIEYRHRTNRKSAEKRLASWDIET